jgi:hypothetical protein
MLKVNFPFILMFAFCALNTRAQTASLQYAYYEKSGSSFIVDSYAAAEFWGNQKYRIGKTTMFVTFKGSYGTVAYQKGTGIFNLVLLSSASGYYQWEESYKGKRTGLFTFWDGMMRNGTYLRYRDQKNFTLQFIGTF